MYRAALQQIAIISPRARVHVPVLSEQAEVAARALGMVPLRVESFSALECVVRRLLAVHPGHVLLLGADGLDGAHDPNFSLSMFALADLCACAGIPGTVTGFSVSKNADLRLKPYFANGNPLLKILVRDPISLERYQQFYGRAELCADLAFLLRPAAVPADALSNAFEWLASQRSSGNRVLGLNIHPLLYQGYSPEQRRAHLEETCQQLVRLLSQSAQKTAVVLIAHDHRDAAADVHCHAVAAPLLRAALGPAFHDLHERAPSHDIKLFAGQLDALISGRMHLCIAALSQGVPVLGINYRDKMEGLASHFGLEGCTVDNASFLQVEYFAPQVHRFLSKLDSIGSTVALGSQPMQDLAHRNFEYLRDTLVLERTVRERDEHPN